ncbi:hypothetical protein G9F71_025300 [Clostridium sp. FP2]|nr:hypothetical protein [Clostridium sp. FP2]MBZ9626126.1 hypothetical protein [Clostridium sp. FP2]
MKMDYEKIEINIIMSKMVTLINYLTNYESSHKKLLGDLLTEHYHKDF